MRASEIILVCPSCRKRTATPRCETDPPGAAELHGIVCPDCDTGGFDMPEYLDADGQPISGDPLTFKDGRQGDVL